MRTDTESFPRTHRIQAPLNAFKTRANPSYRPYATLAAMHPSPRYLSRYSPTNHTLWRAATPAAICQAVEFASLR